jgi:hypothetical protein
MAGSETSFGPDSAVLDRARVHTVDSIARALVPLTPASYKDDGSDWREMSRDVRIPIALAVENRGRG